MKTVLVSGASGIVGYGILKTLSSLEEVCLIGTSIYEDSIAEAFCDIFVQAPLTTNSEYLEWLLNIISRYKVDVIIPGIEVDMQTWAKHYVQLMETGVHLLLNNLDLISLCEDKWFFYKTMLDNELSCTIKSSLNSELSELKKELGFPFLIKPRKGFGSKGVVKIEEDEAFEQYKDLIGEELMVQSFVGIDDEEYSTSVFCDEDSKVLSLLTLKRKLSKDGYTQSAKVVNDEEIEKTIKKLCNFFKPIGPTNFQFRRDEKRGLMLLEINPRISSATSIRSKFGYNEAHMYFQYFLEGKPLDNICLKKGKAIRYIEDYVTYE